VEAVNEFTDRMKDTLEEAKSALTKAKDDMARYYNRRRTPTPVYKPGDKVYLDASDIHTTRPSKKLSHRRLGPFPVERRVGMNAYRLTLLLPMKRLHPVFNVIKLTPAPPDPIPGRHVPPPPPPELIDGEEEYVVEEILDSRMFRRRLQYLVKWEGYGVEGNTWEYSENVENAPEKVADFHTRHPAAPRRIRIMAFGSIPFRPISSMAQASGRCLSRRGGDCKGNPFSPDPNPHDPLARPDLTRPRSPKPNRARSLARPAADRLLTRLTPAPPPVGLYIPPHRRTFKPTH
jgi:hypothetical protein